VTQQLLISRGLNEPLTPRYQQSAISILLCGLLSL